MCMLQLIKQLNGQFQRMKNVYKHRLYRAGCIIIIKITGDLFDFIVRKLSGLPEYGTSSKVCHMI